MSLSPPHYTLRHEYLGERYSTPRQHLPPGDRAHGTLRTGSLGLTAGLCAMEKV